MRQQMLGDTWSPGHSWSFGHAIPALVDGTSSGTAREKVPVAISRGKCPEDDRLKLLLVLFDHNLNMYRVPDLRRSAAAAVDVELA